MENKSFGYFELDQGYGYVLEKAPQEVLDELKVPIDKLKSNFNKGLKYNDHLAGEIQHEYLLEERDMGNKFSSLIKKTVLKYEQNTSHMFNLEAKLTLGLPPPWVNFQKKYEYNPIHYHSGLFSYVLWYQLPYTIENEQKYSFKSNHDQIQNGGFTFHCPVRINDNLTISNTHLKMDKSKEGTFALFPSTLQHSVNPFYSSDDYRITVAGNVHIKSLKSIFSK